MSLAHIETICSEAKIPYERHALGVIVTAVGSYEEVQYPVLISEKETHLQGLVWLPCLVADALNRKDELCRTLNEIFEGDADIGFSEERKSFWAGKILNKSKIPHGLTELTRACDVVFPLVKRIDELGYWDDYLLELACLPADCMNSA
jgi:hypothetical protein